MTDYDAAVFDVMMPKIDGFSLLKKIRNEGNNLPVLFLTARDSIDDRVEGLDIGADEYISEDKAKSIAYDHAGVKVADVKFSKAELDRDDLIVHYDVEFVAGKYEYEYEINAESGKVIAFDKDLRD